MLQGNDVLQSFASVSNKRETLFIPNCNSGAADRGELYFGVGPNVRASPRSGPNTLKYTCGWRYCSDYESGHTKSQAGEN